MLVEDCALEVVVPFVDPSVLVLVLVMVVVVDALELEVTDVELVVTELLDGVLDEDVVLDSELDEVAVEGMEAVRLDVVLVDVELVVERF